MSDYYHISVNHSKLFKDPETGACTNKMEGAWAHLPVAVRDLVYGRF